METWLCCFYSMAPELRHFYWMGQDKSIYHSECRRLNRVTTFQLKMLTAGRHQGARNEPKSSRRQKKIENTVTIVPRGQNNPPKKPVREVEKAGKRRREGQTQWQKNEVSYWVLHPGGVKEMQETSRRKQRIEDGPGKKK